MTRAPSALRYHPGFQDDLGSIKEHNADHAERILRKVSDWENKIEWGRTPQEHLRYLSGSGKYNFYRERIGISSYRVVYEISDGVMTVLAVAPKGDNTYNLEEFRLRMNRL